MSLHYTIFFYLSLWRCYYLLNESIIENYLNQTYGIRKNCNNDCNFTDRPCRLLE